MRISTSQATQEQVEKIVLHHLPSQGQWLENDYLWLTDHSSQLIELTDGYLEPLPMPTETHQLILAYLYTALCSLTQRTGGLALFAPLRLKIRDGKFREPDLLMVRDRQDSRRGEKFWTGADLVIEVVSPDRPERDLIDKRSDYAEAAVAEYWIVNPMDSTILVLCLEGGEYVEHGRFGVEESATSPYLELSLDVSAVFDTP